MAASSTKMKLQRGPVDVWSIRERLALACSVMKSGDQNWVSVSRAIRPYIEVNRPANWFSQKNCALQYSDLLETVETPKRKRGDGGEVDTPSDQIFRKLMTERIEELRGIVMEGQKKYKKVKSDIESIRAGELDSRLSEILGDMLKEKPGDDIEESKHKIPEDSTVEAPTVAAPSSTTSSTTELPVTQPEGFSLLEVPKVEGDVPSVNLTLNVTTPDNRTKAAPPTSPLLSSLLQSKLKSANSLQQLKNEAELADALTHQQQQLVQQLALQLQQSAESAVNQIREAAESENSEARTTSQTPNLAVAPTLSKLLFTPTQGNIVADLSDAVIIPADTIDVQTEDVIVESKTIDITDQDSADENVTVDVTAVDMSSTDGDAAENVYEAASDVATVKDEVDEEPVPKSVKYKGGGKDVTVSQITAPDEDSFLSIDEEISIKDEPASPTSSVSSKISESGGKSFRSRHRKGRGSRSSSRRTITRRSVQDDTSSKHSDVDLSEDDLLPAAGSVFSESIPNSPASLSICSDTEDEKVFKTWKKSIMLVWRSAANHKYANVFLHPVTNEIAPGYKAVVHRPMDLGTIKKSIESGSLRTTAEFQRDIMLMFTNALMYNSTDQPVYKMGMEMYTDVMLQIEQYVNTQMMVQNIDTKTLRQPRRSDFSDKEDEFKKRRTSSEQPQEGGKTKRRKTRADDG